MTAHRILLYGASNLWISRRAALTEIRKRFPGYLEIGLAPGPGRSYGLRAGNPLIRYEALGREVHVVNDADAAGLAEATYGAARGVKGLVIVTTLGTGIGSALIHDGVLVPNSELGHLELDGAVAEQRAASSIKKKEKLSWEEWGERLTRYYRHLDRLFTPDLLVVGGGISKDWKKFGHLIEVDCEIVPAKLKNRAGIVGAALVAARAEGTA